MLSCINQSSLRAIPGGGVEQGEKYLFCITTAISSCQNPVICFLQHKLVLSSWTFSVCFFLLSPLGWILPFPSLPGYLFFGQNNSGSVHSCVLPFLALRGVGCPTFSSSIFVLLIPPCARQSSHVFPNSVRKWTLEFPLWFISNALPTVHLW